MATTVRFWNDRGWMHLPRRIAAVLTLQVGLCLLLAYGAVEVLSNPDNWNDPAFGPMEALMAPVFFAMVFSVPLFLSILPNILAAHIANKRSDHEARWRWVAHFAMVFLFVWYVQALFVIDFLSPLFHDLREIFWRAWWFPPANIILCSVAAAWHGKKRKDAEGAARHLDRGLA
ncbi:hypothetical protein [Sphingomicrobium arenosum]|uniref:hypothetical protein n=1 Tax=Sphingomicrobium arenosum TaxID=2233861 RepID=UPI0022405B72|nr:hypothetical protein [Sphingomicrobium arenosum]